MKGIFILQYTKYVLLQACMAIHNNIDNLPNFKNAVVTIGTFDGVHEGHKVILKKVIEEARHINGESILLTFDPHPRKLIYPDQKVDILTPLDKKLELIKQIGIEHIVVVPFTKAFASLSAERYITDFLVKYFNPSKIVIGYDHHFGHDRAGNIELLSAMKEKYNYEIVEINAQLIDDATISSTKIRNSILSGDIAEANKMLGRPYSIYASVIEGQKLGRTIGYPTANLQADNDEQITPANGVYAVKVLYGENEYKGMLNIGVRPTVSNEKQRHVEVHIFDFDIDIYGENVTVRFVKRLRDEQPFSSIDELKKQLDIDKENAVEALG